MPFTTVWLTLTTPQSPTRFLSSISSRPSSSGVLAKIAQKPIELPKSLSGGVKPGGEPPVPQIPWLKDSEEHREIQFLRMPAMLGALNSNQKYAVCYCLIWPGISLADS